MEVIEEEEFPLAWLRGVKYLKNQPDKRAFNLILSINSPQMLSDRSVSILQKVDIGLKKHQESLHNVAETIFPCWSYRQIGWEGMVKDYLENIYPRIKKYKGNSWGTYAHRMLYRKNKDEVVINPLDVLIRKVKSQLRSKGSKRACYEINILDENLELPIFDSRNDSRRIIGGPCLSHLSFKVDPKNKKLYLTVIYRSHYYVKKALGNLLGLARLQQCICEETGLAPGPMVCISSYAQVDSGLKHVKNLIQKL